MQFQHLFKCGYGLLKNMGSSQFGNLGYKSVTLEVKALFYARKL